MKHLVSLSSAVLAVALVAGCATGQNAAAPGAALPAGNWATSDGLTVKILDGQMLASTQCNRFGAPVAAQDNRLVFGTIKADSRACTAAMMPAENAVMDFFQSNPPFVLKDRSTLVIGSEGQQITLKRTPVVLPK